MSIRIGIGLDIFSNRIDPEAQSIYNRIIAIPNGFSNLSRLNYFVKGLKAIYGTLSNVPVCYDAHWIGGVLGSGVGATAGQACARLCSLTVAGDAVQTTAASQPLLLSHNGASSDNYLYAGPGSDVAGAYCQTSTNVSPQINTNFTFEFNFKDFNSRGILAGCPTGSSDGWSLQIQSVTNVLRLYVRILSVNTAIDSTVGINVTGNRWVKVVRSGNNYSFFEKADGGTYTQVGTTVTNSTVLNSYTLPIQIGNGFQSNYIGIGCKILRAKFYSDSTETNLVSDFNPATYNASTSQTQWTSATGEVWTINKASSLTLQGSLVDRTQVIGNGSSYFMANLETGLRPASNTQYVTYLNAFNDGGGNRQVIDSNSNNWYNSIEAGGPFVNLYMNGAVSSIATSKSIKSLDLIVTSTNAGVQNAIRKNNGASTTNTYSPTPSGNGLTLFSRFGGTFASAVILNTYVCVNGADSDATKTATYNFIRSLNNNAF